MPARPYTPRHARRRSHRAPAVLLAVAATAGIPLAASPASAASAADWQKLAVCESGGNWSINTGNGYYGGLQFSSSTWLAFGGGAYASRADLASPAQQMAIADKVLASQGWNAWPSCSRSTGLYGTPTTPTPPPPPPKPMVVGAIAQHYAALGGAGSVVGTPWTYELGTARGGRYNLFTRGAIYWTLPTGAREVHGEVQRTWVALGAENGVLGFPVTDELATPTRPGRFNRFEGGSVYWSPTTGSHEVHGQVGLAWAAQGWETGYLGFPTSGEVGVPGRVGVTETFEGGTITWSPETGAHAVRGAIRDEWLRMGGPTSPLGLATSSEFAVGNGRRTTFEHGTLTWWPKAGVKVGPR